MLCLYVQAPFAAFRTFTAGSFRPTTAFLTPSAAYGLLLNLASIEMREEDGSSPMTVIRTGLPKVEIALGLIGEPPARHSLYQQLHNYPVGNSGKEHAEATRGNKYNIVPARRGFLSDLRAYVAVRGDAALEQRIRDGLAGRLPRYGLPFLGDNNFLPDRIEEQAPGPARWLLPVGRESGAGEQGEVGRYTLTIDRADMSNTRSALLAPGGGESTDIPDQAWVAIGY